jgi:hypothetical protein
LEPGGGGGGGGALKPGGGGGGGGALRLEGGYGWGYLFSYVTTCFYCSSFNNSSYSFNF